MYDCIVIGGGPAGLTAATYLGRFRRTVLLIDAAESRLKRVPLARNAPGYPDGIKGAYLHAQMREQAEKYGGRFLHATVQSLERTPAGFRIATSEEDFSSSTVLIATGSKLNEPDLPNIDEALARGVLCYCPICDGFEAAGMHVAVLGRRASALAEAHFLRRYTEHVTFLRTGDAEPPDAQQLDEAKAAGISVATEAVVSFTAREHIEVRFDSGRTARYDRLYPCLGCTPQSDLANAIGARVSAGGGILVDAHQRTSTPFAYAAGDVLQGLDQIAAACGQAAIAATAIHNDLRDVGH